MNADLIHLKVTFEERALLIDALMASARRWPRDVKAGARRDRALWLKDMPGGPRRIAFQRVDLVDFLDCLGYVAATHIEGSTEEAQVIALMRRILIAIGPDGRIRHAIQVARLRLQGHA